MNRVVPLFYMVIFNCVGVGVSLFVRVCACFDCSFITLMSCRANMVVIHTGFSK